MYQQTIVTSIYININYYKHSKCYFRTKPLVTSHVPLFRMGAHGCILVDETHGMVDEGR